MGVCPADWMASERQRPRSEGDQKAEPRRARCLSVLPQREQRSQSSLQPRARLQTLPDTVQHWLNAARRTGQTGALHHAGLCGV